MGLLKLKKAISKYKKLYLDTPCFIYYFEKNLGYASLLGTIFKDLAQRRKEAVTSCLSVMETLILPKKKENIDLEQVYFGVFKHYPNLIVLDFNFGLANLAAKLRAKYNIKAPDAIHLATAISSNAQTFITNDPKLKQIREIPILILRDYL